MRLRLKSVAKSWPRLQKGVKSVIIADFRENESDSMTDYFGYRTTKVVYIAFSGHGRGLFKEMRKAAQNCSIPVFCVTKEKGTSPYLVYIDTTDDCRQNAVDFINARLPTKSAEN